MVLIQELERDPVGPLAALLRPRQVALSLEDEAEVVNGRRHVGMIAARLGLVAFCVIV